MPRQCVECHCESESCKQMIENDYRSLVTAICDADSILPRHKSGVEKDWWTSHLSNLKSQSVDIHRLCIAEGRPRHGSTNLERIRIRAIYRNAIKSAQRAPKQTAWNQLHTAMIDNDTNDLWKSLYSGKQKKCSCCEWMLF